MKANEDVEKILKQSEEIDSQFDKSTLVELLHSIRKKYDSDIMLRNKYKNDSMKYCTIEEKLHEDLVVMQRLAAYPNLLSSFISHNGIEIIVLILSHPNIDIVSAMLSLIVEITESDFLNDIEDPKSFIELLISNSIFDRIAETLYKIDSNDEDSSQYYSDILGIFENFIDVYEKSAELIGTTKALGWMLQMIRKNCTVDSADIAEGDVCLFCSEVLAMLVQFSGENQKRFAKMEGVPILINVLVNIKENTNRKILIGNQEELVNNIVDCICSALLYEENKKMFAMADGVNIMIDFMRENNTFRHLGIKILNFAIQNSKDNAIQFVESNGLCVLFPYFMSRGMKKIKKEIVSKGEESSIEIIVNLLRYVNGVNYDRVIYKFKENNNEKIKRLIEVYYKRYKDSDEYITKMLCVIVMVLLKQGKEVESKVREICEENKIDIESEIKIKVKEMKNEITGEDEKQSENDYKSFLNKLIN